MKLLTYFLLLVVFATSAQKAFSLDDVVYPPEFYKNYSDTTPMKRSLCSVNMIDSYSSVVHNDIAAVGGHDEGSGGPDAVISGKYQRFLGTCWVYAESENSYFIMTAGHVVLPTAGTAPLIQFNYAGHRSRLLPALVNKTLYVKNTLQDYAVLQLSKDELQGYPDPTVIPIADYTESLVLKEFVVVPAYESIHFTQVRKIGLDNFVINEPIRPGMSGSPVFNQKGTKALGMVLGLDGSVLRFESLHEYAYRK